MGLGEWVGLMRMAGRKIWGDQTFHLSLLRRTGGGVTSGTGGPGGVLGREQGREEWEGQKGEGELST